jgi:FkbM family methyltransferase
MNIKKIIKDNSILSKTIVPLYRFIYNLPRRITRIMKKKHSSMLKGELKLFKAIYGQCKTIVDVGARYDVDYVTISKDNGIAYYLFEANPNFYKKLLKNIKKFDENIIAENLAIGEKSGFVEYYTDSESILKNTTAVKNSNKKLSDTLPMISLNEYLNNVGIMEIDFLKTDIEEYDYFALIGLEGLLNNCRFIQFELGIGAPLNDSVVTNASYYDLLEPIFDLYIVKDENNPIWKKKAADSDLVILDNNSKELIEVAQKTGVGFNIFCVNRNMQTDIQSLTKSNLFVANFQDGFFP